MNEATLEIYFAEPSYLIKHLETIENVSPAETQSILEFMSENNPPPQILSIDGDTAIIRIEGLLVKSGVSFISRFRGLIETSYDDIIKSVEEISADENIKFVRLIMNTPGGETSGVDEAFQALKALSASRHITAENHGVVASAGYYLAVAANKIISTSPSNSFGSIGTIAVGRDATKLENEIGIKTVRIISRQSPRKAGIHSKAGRDDIQDRMDALTRVFIQRVSEGRNVSQETVEKDFGRGGMFVAQDPDDKHPDALSTGMIDSVISDISLSDSSESNIISTGGDENTSEAETDTPEITSATPDGPDKTIKGRSVQTAQKPAKAVIKDQEGIMETLTLSQFFDTHSSAKAEYDAALVKAKADGVEEASKAFQEKVTAVAPFIGSDKYPKGVTAHAMSVLAGKMKLDVFTGAIMSYDMQAESKAGGDAETETGDLKETAAAGGGANELSASGELKDNSNFEAEIKREKSRLGQGE
ncbi:MAG: S49 family peptidase [Thermoplasmata archaeon]|nr:S49 family peptidase [Thermoplasmata archaeon]